MVPGYSGMYLRFHRDSKRNEDMGIAPVRIRHVLRFNDYGLADYISDLVGVVSDLENQFIES